MLSASNVGNFSMYNFFFPFCGFLNYIMLCKNAHFCRDIDVCTVPVLLHMGYIKISFNAVNCYVHLVSCL
jgi:hypothetical protein